MLTSYRLIPVNRWTWDDMPPAKAVRGVLSAEVTKQVGDGSNLLDSATLSISADLSYEFADGWYRPEAVYSGEENRRIPIATLWVYPTSDVVRGNHKVISLNGESVLKPLSERKILSGDFVAKGANAADKIRQLVKEAMPYSPVEVRGSFTLNNYYVFESGQSYLSIVWGLLDKADWCMQVTPNGQVIILPKPEDPKLLIDGSRKNLFKPDISRDYSGKNNLPNRLKVIDQYGQEYIVENHQPTSSIAYENLGRWVDAVDTSPQQKDGETTLAYAHRQLEQLSTWAYSYTFETHWLDDVLLYDIMRVTLPNEGVAGDLRVISQNISCGTHLNVSWTVGREVKEYVAWRASQSTLAS